MRLAILGGKTALNQKFMRRLAGDLMVKLAFAAMHFAMSVSAVSLFARVAVLT